MIDWLTHRPMKIEPIEAAYDTLHLAGAAPQVLSRPFEAQKRDLKDRFPDEAKAIKAWFVAVGRRDLQKEIAKYCVLLLIAVAIERLVAKAL